MSEYRPSHKLTLTKSKGKVIASCICGWKQVGKSETEDDAVSRYRKHTGIYERPRR